MATTLLHIRRLIERTLRHLNSPLWPTWSLLTYHGNPYAHLPPAPTDQPSAHLAKSLNLTPAAAHSLIRSLRPAITIIQVPRLIGTDAIVP